MQRGRSVGKKSFLSTARRWLKVEELIIIVLDFVIPTHQLNSGAATHCGRYFWCQSVSMCCACCASAYRCIMCWFECWRPNSDSANFAKIFSPGTFPNQNVLMGLNSLPDSDFQECIDHQCVFKDAKVSYSLRDRDVYLSLFKSETNSKSHGKGFVALSCWWTLS